LLRLGYVMRIPNFSWTFTTRSRRGVLSAVLLVFGFVTAFMGLSETSTFRGMVGIVVGTCERLSRRQHWPSRVSG